MSVEPKYELPDQQELDRFFKDIKTPEAAYYVRDEIRFQNRFQLYAVQVTAPDGVAVIREYHFRDKKAADAAVKHSNDLLK